MTSHLGTELVNLLHHTTNCTRTLTASLNCAPSQAVCGNATSFKPYTSASLTTRNEMAAAKSSPASSSVIELSSLFENSLSITMPNSPPVESQRTASYRQTHCPWPAACVSGNTRMCYCPTRKRRLRRCPLREGLQLDSVPVKRADQYFQRDSWCRQYQMVILRTSPSCIRGAWPKRTHCLPHSV